MNRKQGSRFAIRVLGLFMVILALGLTATAEWKEKVLYSFQGLPSDGAYPAGGVVFDKAGNLYGVTGLGGGSVTECPGIAQCGIVYQLKPPTQKGKSWTEAVLYIFKGVKHYDGNTPQGGVIFDQAGNLYGTTSYGGSGPCQLFGGRVGCGTVFELLPPKQNGGKWTEKVLHSFQSGKDGYFPWGDLTWDSAGNLYGATQYGGGYGSCNAPYYQFCGTVFKLSPPKMKGDKWTETVLYAFKSGTDGANPNGGLVLDDEGAIYGTTYSGGNQRCKYEGEVGCGTAFKLQPKIRSSWAETLLHRFDRTSSDGGNPMAGMILDEEGRLYGTTLNGGPGPGGIVFRLSPPPEKSGPWQEAILHGFNGNKGGYDPESTLTFDGQGNLYGTTYVGSGEELQGSVFRLKPQSTGQGQWVIDFLHGFVKVPDGLFPAAALVFDAHGVVYSTTQEGGVGTGCGDGDGGCGTVFEVSPPTLK